MAGKTGIDTSSPLRSVNPIVPPMSYTVGVLDAAESSGMNVNVIVPILLSGSVALPSITLKTPL